MLPLVFNSKKVDMANFSLLSSKRQATNALLLLD